MAMPSHVYETYIKAPPERVWAAIVDPEQTRRYFHRTRFVTDLHEGAPHKYVLADGSDAVDGVVEEIEPGRRLVITWHPLYDAGLAAEPPGRVEWIVEAADEAGAVTRVRLRHFDLGASPKTSANVQHGWTVVLDGLKTFVETGDELGDVRASAVQENDASWHRAAAVEANGETWELLDGRELDDDARADLLARAHAAAYHWRRAGRATAANEARAAWLVSRCAAVAGLGDYARERAMASLRICERGDVADFDVVYAHEALARAHACLGDLDAARRELDVARALDVADVEDRAIVEADLAAEPWFGLSPASETVS